MSAIEVPSLACVSWLPGSLRVGGEGELGEGRDTLLRFSRRRAYSSRTSCSSGVSVWVFEERRLGGEADMVRGVVRWCGGGEVRVGLGGGGGGGRWGVVGAVESLVGWLG